MAPTIQEIADTLGISKTTVHRALSGTGRISLKTKQKILDLAKELNYTPNTIAQSLRSKRTMTIGLVLRDIIVGHYYAEILAGIESVAKEKGYVINIACSEDDITRESEILQNFCMRQVDGIIIAPVKDSNLGNYDLLERYRIPFIFIDKYIENIKADIVTADCKTGVKEAVKLLYNSGKRRIAFLNGYESGCITISQRIEGYEEQLSELHATYTKIIESKLFANEDKLCGHLAIKQELIGSTQDNKIDALICANDSLAFGALKAITEVGLKIPQDIAIVGNNNDIMTEYVQPMLTTISQPKLVMGRMAINLLISRIEEEKKASETKYYALPVTLIVRGST